MPTFVELSCDFFNKFGSLELREITSQTTIKHFTDWKRFTLLENYSRPVSRKGLVRDLPCVVKLHESGIQFKNIGNEAEHSLLDIRFEKSKQLISFFEVHELQIPQLSIVTAIEYLLRNIIALEQCLYPEDAPITNYIDLMNYLINTEEDVDLLVRNGIISNYMGDNASVAKMFNSLDDNITVGESFYYSICEQLKDHYQNPWNRSKATLKRVYFNNPWRGTATVAAIILLLLTVV